MKKQFILIGLLLLSAGCSRDNLNSRSADEIKTVTFGAEDFFDPEASLTKTSIVDETSFIWSEGDTVGIYPNTGAQVYFAMESGAGAKSAEFDGGGWDFKPSATYYSYYPFIGDIYLDRHNIPVSFTGQAQTGTTGVSHIGAYDFMYTPATSSSNSSLNFSYKHLCSILRLRLVLQADTYTKLAVTAPSNVFITKGYYDLQSASPAIVGTEYSNQLQIALNDITLSSETEFYVYMMTAPVNLQGTAITVSVLNSQKKEFQCAKTPSYEYAAGSINKMGCTSWTEVPQNMGMIIEDWGNSGTVSGDAD